MNNNNKKLIILSGGGTAGPVTPLIAVADELTAPVMPGESLGGEERRESINSFEFLWIGTKKGPEKRIVEERGIKFKSISSGKLRRYWSIMNFVDPFLILIGFVQSLILIIKIKPSLVMSAGGFVSVPLAWAAWIMKVPVIIHQQDIRPGLANKLMAPVARVVTVTFEKSVKDYKKKGIWTGNPVRKEFKKRNFSTEEAYQEFRIPTGSKVMLVMGGGTGAQAINNFVFNNLKKITRDYYLIHLVGNGKLDNEVKNEKYKQFEFLDVIKMRKAYEVSDIVVSRCGIGSLTELSVLGKLSVLIPIPDTHQEENAALYFKEKAAVVMDQFELEIDDFMNKIKKINDNFDLRSRLRNNIKEVIKKDAEASMAALIKKII